MRSVTRSASPDLARAGSRVGGLRWRPVLRQVLIYVAALIALVYLIAPFYWLVLNSFMTREEAIAVPPHWLPQNPILDNYRAFFDPSILNDYREETRLTVGSVVTQVPKALTNSAITAFTVAILNIVIGAVSAYPFARLQFPGRGPLLILYLATRMVPALALVLPVFLVMRQLALLDSLGGLILMYLSFTLPYTVWILKNYFQSIPRDLEDAALVDGCSRGQAMVRILLPLAVPGLISVGMFAFMSSWGEFLFALILTTKNARTMPVEATFLVNELNVEYGFLAAAAMLAVIPPLVLALLFQRLIVQGIAAGALKG